MQQFPKLVKMIRKHIPVNLYKVINRTHCWLDFRVLSTCQHISFCAMLHLISAFVRLRLTAVFSSCLFAVAEETDINKNDRSPHHALYIILTFLFINLSSPSPSLFPPTPSLTLSQILLLTLLQLNFLQFTLLSTSSPLTAFLHPSVSWAFCSHTARHVRWSTYVICTLHTVCLFFCRSFSIDFVITTNWSDLQNLNYSTAQSYCMIM